MLDYHVHVASLEVIQEALDLSIAGSPHADAWQATKDATASEPGSALLGTLLAHLLERSQGSQAEQDILEKGASLYKSAAEILQIIEPLRSQFEAMIQEPGTAEIAQLQDIMAQLQSLQPVLTDLTEQVNTYRAEVLPPYRHVAAHAIAHDKPVNEWLWRDVILSRRTEAFVRELYSSSDGSASTLSFAFGALAGYAANTVGSSFIAQVVGGPRRSYPIRDRVARYSVGAWLKANEPALCYPLNKLREQLTFGGLQALPIAIQNQINAALAATYPTGAPAQMPDLEKGYANLLRHLELLESFPPLAPVADIPPALLVQIMQNPDALKTLIKPTDWNWPDNDPTQPPQPPNTGPSQPGDNKKSDGGCGALIVAILITITIIGIIICKLVTGRYPWELFAGQSSPGSSAQAFTTFVNSNDALIMVALFYHLHNNLSEAVSIGTRYLKRVGILYPDGLDLVEPLFSQFTHLVTPGPKTDHPHTPLSNPDLYVDFPTTPIEQPATLASLYPEGATPSFFLRETPGPREATASVFAVELWSRLQDALPGEDGTNLNLDADRGFQDLCWRIADGRSITDNPLPFEILSYGDVE